MKPVLTGLLLIVACGPAHGQSYALFTFDPPAGTTFLRIWGINNSGQILGEYRDSSQAIHQFLRSADGATFAAIDVPGAAQTYGAGINNLGQVIGTYTDPAGTHSFIRSADGKTYTTFDVPPEGGIATRPGLPIAMNDKGEIVGTSFSAASVEWGFLRSADGATYATIQVPKAGWTQVLGINNNG